MALLADGGFLGTAVSGQPLAIDLVRPVVFWTGIGLTVAAAVIELFAFAHCLFQRSDAFNAVGTLSKPVWLLLTGAGAALTVVVGVSPVGILGMIGLVAAAVYLLDVRPAIRDVINGSGSW